MDSIFNYDDILYDILRHSDYNVTHKLYLLLRPRKLIYKALAEIESNHLKIKLIRDKIYKNDFIKELIKEKELIFGIEVSHCILDTLNNKDYYYNHNRSRWHTGKLPDKTIGIPIDNFDIIKDPKHLICFKNGVYDLKQSKFRKANKFDYCTLTTGDYFPENINNDKLRNYKLKLFPIKEDYIHFMKILYLIFLGKQYYINTVGTNCNGFTTLNSILRYIFFDYTKIVPARTLNNRVMYQFHTFLQEYKRDNYKLLILDDNTSIENLEQLVSHCCIIQHDYSNIYDLNHNIPQTKPLYFRSTFGSKNEKPEKYVYLKDNIEVDVFAKGLMSQLINIHQSVEAMMIFNYNDYLNADVKHLIIEQYMNVIFDV